MIKPEYKRRGARKGAVGNPTGKNQYDNIYSSKPTCVNLLIEDDNLLNELASDRPRGWKSDFIRDVVHKALKDF